jgi:hypothetical protein
MDGDDYTYGAVATFDQRISALLTALELKVNRNQRFSDEMRAILVARIDIAESAAKQAQRTAAAASLELLKANERIAQLEAALHIQHGPGDE